MTTGASSLTNFRKDPSQPGAWLKAFRRATPRCQRQHLIDTLNVFAFLEELAHAQFWTGEAYMRVIYVIAARRLEAPDASSAAEREVLRHRVGRVFGLATVEVARDVTRMRLQLEHDHRRWLAQRQRQRSVAARAGGSPDGGGSHDGKARPAPPRDLARGPKTAVRSLRDG